MRRLLSLLLLTIFTPTVNAAETTKPHVVVLIAEREYQTDQTLPAFAKQYLGEYRTTFVLADPQDRNQLIGIDSVDTADVLLVSVRRRTLPEQQFKACPRLRSGR